MIIRFTATESVTLPFWTANQGGSFAFMGTLRLYTKQALSISEQIELLKSRGLNIADSSKAAKFLGEVSYFRFVQYLRPMEADKTTHQFKPISRFEDAVALYNFDIELRGLQQTIIVLWGDITLQGTVIPLLTSRLLQIPQPCIRIFYTQ